MIKFTQTQIEEIIQLHDEGWLNKDIAKKFNTSISTINRRLAARNVCSRHPSLSDERKQQAIVLYKKYFNINRVSKELHMSNKTVHDILVEHDIKIMPMSLVVRKDKNIDHNYFHQINTYRKSYFLGLLYADGTMTRPPRNSIAIALQERDKYILDKFQEELQTSYKYCHLNYSQKNSNWMDQEQLTITHAQIYTDLLHHGVHPNKSLTLKFPSTLDIRFIPSFLLGYLDGDGTIGKNECRTSFVGTTDFCLCAKQLIEQQLNIHCSVYHPRSANINTSILSIAGRHQVKIFLDWIYHDCDIYLQRKHNIYLSKYCA